MGPPLDGAPYDTLGPPMVLWGPRVGPVGTAQLFQQLPLLHVLLQLLLHVLLQLLLQQDSTFILYGMNTQLACC